MAPMAGARQTWPAAGPGATTFTIEDEMTFPNGSGGVRTPSRSQDLPPNDGLADTGSTPYVAQDIDSDGNWQPPVALSPAARGPALLLLAAVVAIVVAVVLFLFVLRSSDGDQTIGDAAPASPSGSVDQASADNDGDQPGPETFSAEAPVDGSSDANESAASAESESPDALVITSGDVENPDPAASADGASAADSSLSGAAADQSTTVAPSTTAPPTTVTTTTLSSTTVPPTTQPPATEAPTTQPPATQPATTQPPATTASTAAPTTAPPAPAPSGGDGAIQQEVLNLTNAERAAAGCGPVVLDPTLNAVADAHSEDMAANNYFDHTGLNGSQPWDRVQAAGYPAGGSGENIAQGYSTAQSVVTGWMNSAGHRRNILNCSWTELGVGYANGSSARNNIPPIYWTQVFATRR